MHGCILAECNGEAHANARESCADTSGERIHAVLLKGQGVLANSLRQAPSKRFAIACGYYAGAPDVALGHRLAGEIAEDGWPRSSAADAPPVQGFSLRRFMRRTGKGDEAGFFAPS